MTKAFDDWLNSVGDGAPVTLAGFASSALLPVEIRTIDTVIRPLTKLGTKCEPYSTLDEMIETFVDPSLRRRARHSLADAHNALDQLGVDPNPNLVARCEQAGERSVELWVWKTGYQVVIERGPLEGMCFYLDAADDEAAYKQVTRYRTYLGGVHSMRVWLGELSIDMRTLTVRGFVRHSDASDEFILF